MKLRAFIRKNFVAGLLVLLPIYAIVVLLLWLLQVLTGITAWIPESIHPKHFFVFPGVETLWNIALVILLFFIVALTGVASKNFLFGKLLALFETFVDRLPVLRSVYSGLRQLLQASMGEGSLKNFNSVVLVQWPHEGSWTLAFVTGTYTNPEPGMSANKEEKFLNVYVPTTPNPTGGYWVIVQESKTIPSSLSVEEAFKVILSLGIAKNEVS